MKTVTLCVENYQGIERVKLALLKARVVQAEEDIKVSNTSDGDSFMDELIAGQYDEMSRPTLSVR